MKCASLILLIFLVTIILLYDSAAIAQDFIIGDGDDYEYFEVSESWFGFPTPTVDMNGGHVGNWDDGTSGMYIYDQGLLNVYDGTIDYLHIYNSGTVNISGGLVSHFGCSDTETITAFDSSTVNVYEGAFLFGGSFHHFTLYNSSTANIYGGDVALFLLAGDASTVNVFNGTCSYGIISGDNSTTNVYGGYIDVYVVEPLPATATVNIHGYNFEYDPQAGGQPGSWISKLTGFGPDGTGITYWGLPDPSTNSNVNLIPDFVMNRGVNFADFAAFASSWQSKKGEPHWSHYYDISDPNDGIVDERDLAVFTKYWLAGVE